MKTKLINRIIALVACLAMMISLASNVQMVYALDDETVLTDGTQVEGTLMLESEPQEEDLVVAEEPETEVEAEPEAEEETEAEEPSQPEEAEEETEEAEMAGEAEEAPLMLLTGAADDGEAEAAEEVEAAEEAVEAEEAEDDSLMLMSVNPARYEQITLYPGTEYEETIAAYNFKDDINKIVVTVNGTEIELGSNSTYDELIGENLSFSVRLYYSLEGGTLGDGVNTIFYRAPAGLKLKENESGMVTDPENTSTVVGRYGIVSSGDDTLVAITFYDSYVNNNANGNPITDAYVTWGASVTREQVDTAGKKDVAFTADHKINFNFYQMEKTGVLSDDGASITWTVDLNGNNAELQGYTLTDVIYHYYSAKPDQAIDETASYSFADNVTLKNVTKNTSETISLPYTFDSSTTDAYQLTYTTEVDSTKSISAVKNQINLTKGGVTFSDTAKVDILDPPSISKKEGNVTYSEDGKTAFLTWKITINSGWSGIPANGQAMTDTINGALHRISGAQAKEAKQAFDAALAEQGLSDLDYSFYVTVNGEDLTVDQLDDSALYDNFNIRLNETLPAGNNLSFTYGTQVDMSKQLQDLTVYNTLTVDGVSQRVGKWFKPKVKLLSIDKTDKLDSKSKTYGTTTHDYYDSALKVVDGEAGGLTADWSRRLVWTIVANVNQAYESEKELVISDLLPAAFTYEDVVLGITDLYSSGTVVYTKVSTEPTTIQVNGNDVTVQAVQSVNNWKIEVHLPKELVNLRNDGGQRFTVDVYACLDNRTALINGDKAREGYLNYAYLNADIGNLVANQQINVTNKDPDNGKAVNKEILTSDQVKNGLAYSVTINPERLDLSENSDVITVEDVLSYQVENETNFDLALADLAGTRVQIVKLNESGQPEEVSEDEVVYTYHTTEKDGVFYRTLSFQLADETPYQIIYLYLANGLTGIKTTVTNTVSLNGSTEAAYFDTEEKELEIQNSSASATTKFDGVRLRKVDFDQQFAGIQGVVFDLYQVNGADSMTMLKTVDPTDSNGYADLLNSSGTHFAYNTLYALQEKAAPTGYQDETAKLTYFYIANAEGTGAPNLETYGLSADQVQVVHLGGVVTVSNKRLVDLTLIKVDADDPEVEASVLQGVAFSLYRLGRSSENTDDTLIASGTTNENARLIFASLERDVVYKLVEDKAPEGYVTATEPLYFYIASGDEQVTVDYSAVPEEYKDAVRAVTTMDHTMEYENKKVVLNLIKVDATNSGTTLSGAEFDLWIADGQSPDIIPYTSVYGTKVQSGITDGDGKLAFSSLKDGTYYLVETKAPTGYVLPGQAVELVIENGVITLQNGQETDYTIASGISGVTVTGTTTTTVGWSFCINPLSAHPTGTGGYTLKTDVDFNEVAQAVADDNYTLTPAQYQQIKRAMYWFYAEYENRPSEVSSAMNTDNTWYDRSNKVKWMTVYEYVQYMIHGIIQGKKTPETPSVVTDAKLDTLLWGDGSSTGLVFQDTYDAEIDATISVDLFIRPETKASSGKSYQNMITIRTLNVDTGVITKVDDTTIQVPNTPGTDLPETGGWNFTVTKAWKGDNSENRTDQVKMEVYRVSTIEGVEGEPEKVDEITLTADTGWTYESKTYFNWDENGNPCTYFVKEAGENENRIVAIGANAYRVSYEIKDTEDGRAITVTNTLVQNINQPETGANTRWMAMFGGAGMILSAALYFSVQCLRRRRAVSLYDSLK